MIGWFKQFRLLTAAQQVRLLWILGVFFAALTLLLVALRNDPIEPGQGNRVSILGKISVAASGEKSDRSMVNFSVKFPLPGSRLYHTSGAYAFKDAYQAAGAKLHMPVYITIDEHGDPSLVREVVTLDGHVLYEEWMYARIQRLNQQSDDRGTVFFALVSLASFIGSAVIGWRQRYRATPVA
ncbi:hypothetical protein [Pseudomonas fontis]|uniref:DUF3592 domain-containing protein n=1 Tax=Pseudomonas fontis TaxID=2942633 RepID=A0ABT5NPK9_9PSED|nr:hypothetical protein [Pseudomonas fontis]MDD0972419.1 hypothetical protein [Pseudomonas fontis]MDD0990124.1 hypothetical protein [Pseudomonas fontis]